MRPTSLSVRDFRPLPRALPADTGAPPGARRALPYPKNEPLCARGGADASARGAAPRALLERRAAIPCVHRAGPVQAEDPLTGARARARQRLGARRVRAAEL